MFIGFVSLANTLSSRERFRAYEFDEPKIIRRHRAASPSAVPWRYDAVE